MHLFDELFGLASDGPLTLQLTGDATNHTLTINVMPHPANTNAARVCRPLSLTATPDELNGGFCDALRQFRDAHHDLMAQASIQITAVRAVTAQSASAKNAPKTGRTTPKLSLPYSTPSLAAEGKAQEDDGAEQEDSSDGPAPVATRSDNTGNGDAESTRAQGTLFN